MKLETAFATHMGGRDEQQDRVAVFSAPDGGARLLVVADGMGGHAGGSLAAQAVIDAAEEAWHDNDFGAGDPKALLKNIVASAHKAINRIGEAEGLSPRSTCVILYLDGTRAVWTHVGDSRLYRFRGGRLLERTRDHSVVQMLLDMGKITEEQMGTHPDQNRLTQSMGGESEPEADLDEDQVEEGDSFILCSDGLWEMVSQEEMAAGVTNEALPKLADKLPGVAFERAGAKSDNISIAVARVGAPKAGAAAALPAAGSGRGRGRVWTAVALVLILGAGGVVALTQFTGPSSETKAPLSPTAAPPTTPAPKPAPAPKTDPKPDPKADPKADPPPAPKPRTEPGPTPAPPTTKRPQDATPSTPGTPKPGTPKTGDVDDRKGGAPGSRPSETPPAKSDTPPSETLPADKSPADKSPSETPKAADPTPGSPPKTSETPKGPAESQDTPKKPDDTSVPKATDPPRDTPTTPSPDKDGGDSGTQ